MLAIVYHCVYTCICQDRRCRRVSYTAQPSRPLSTQRNARPRHEGDHRARDQDARDQHRLQQGRQGHRGRGQGRHLCGHRRRSTRLPASTGAAPGAAQELADPRAGLEGRVNTVRSDLSGALHNVDTTVEGLMERFEEIIERLETAVAPLEDRLPNQARDLGPAGSRSGQGSPHPAAHPDPDGLRLTVPARRSRSAYLRCRPRTAVREQPLRERPAPAGRSSRSAGGSPEPRAPASRPAHRRGSLPVVPPASIRCG